MAMPFVLDMDASQTVHIHFLAVRIEARVSAIVAEQAHRGHEAVAERHQRRAVEMRDQGQQEILVIEFR